MAKKDFGNFFENSLGDLGENSTIKAKSNELENVLNSNPEERESDLSPHYSPKKESSLKLRKEKIRENLPPALRKTLKKADAISDESNGSIRLNKEIIQELKIAAIKLEVPAYKVVTVLIQEFLKKNQ